MNRGSTSISYLEFKDTINIEDINKMLGIMHLPENVFVTVVVRGDDWYPNEAIYENEKWYLTVNLSPEEARKMGPEQFTVAVKDALIRYLETLELAA